MGIDRIFTVRVYQFDHCFGQSTEYIHFSSQPYGANIHILSQQMQLQSRPLNQQEVIQSLRQQIEFYFSLANLAVDQSLRTLMRQTAKRWVSVEYLLKCHKIQSIIFQSTYQTASKAVHTMLLKQAVESSDKLRHYEEKVKHAKRIKMSEEFNRVFYFERKDGLQASLIYEILEVVGVKSEKIIVNWKQSCCFIEFPAEDAHHVQAELSKLKDICIDRGVTVLEWTQIQEAQASYEAILAKCGRAVKPPAKRIIKQKHKRRELNTQSVLSPQQKRKRRKEQFQPILQARRKQRRGEEEMQIEKNG